MGVSFDLEEGEVIIVGHCQGDELLGHCQGDERTAAAAVRSAMPARGATSRARGFDVCRDSAARIVVQHYCGNNWAM